jgi:hypothetical protein
MPSLGIPGMTITIRRVRARSRLRRATFRAKLGASRQRLAARFTRGWGGGLGIRFDFFAKALRRFFDAGLKFPNRLAHRFADLRQLAGPKNQERDDENDNQVSGL